MASRPRDFRWDFVIKVGGSLGRVEPGRRGILTPLLRALASLARRRRVLLVPGGGVFADLVRRETRRLALGEAAAHDMALLAMDQYGLALAAMAPRGTAVADLLEARRSAGSGRLPILLASCLVARRPELERSFRLTSDSIAAWIAARIGARRLVLLKSVAGLAGPLRGREAAVRLARRGVVDPLFPDYLPAGIPTWILDGRDPSSLDRFSREGGRPRRHALLGGAAPPGSP